MANNTIQLIVAAKNQASATLNTVNKQIQAIQKTAASGGGGGTNTGIIPPFVGPTFTAIGSVLALGAAITTAASSAGQAAASYERLEAGADSLGAQFGLSANSIINSIDSIAQGTLSQTQILQQANQAMLLGVADTAEEFELLTKIAVDRGRKMGISMEKAFSSIVLGVGRLSPLILDNLGIVIDAENTYKAYADTIGKTADTLTDFEKRQAILNRLRKDVNDFDSSKVLDAASAWERFTSSLTDATNRMGDWLNQYTPLVDAIQNLATFIDETSLVLFANEDTEQFERIRIEIDRTTEYINSLKRTYNELSNAPFGSILGSDQVVFQELTVATEKKLELEKQLFALSMQITREETARARAVLKTKEDSAQRVQEEEKTVILQERMTELMREYSNYNQLTTTETAIATKNFIEQEGSLEAAVALVRQLVDGLNDSAAAAQRVSSIMGSAFGSLRSAAGEAYVNYGFNQNIVYEYQKQLDYLKVIQSSLVGRNASEEEIFFTMLEAEKAATATFDILNEQAKALNNVSSGASRVSGSFSELKSIVSGIFSDMYSDIGGVNVDDFLPREDAPNEAARRIADVMVKGFESPWAKYFQDEFPDLFKDYIGRSGGDVKMAAALLLKDFQNGLAPELIDVNAVKELAKRAFQVDQSTKAMIEQISRELADELQISVEEASGYVGAAAGGTGLVTKDAIDKTNNALSFTPKFNMSGVKTDMVDAGKAAGLFDDTGKILLDASVKVVGVVFSDTGTTELQLPANIKLAKSGTDIVSNIISNIGNISLPVSINASSVNSGETTASKAIVGAIGKVETPVYLSYPSFTTLDEWKKSTMELMGTIGVPIAIGVPGEEELGVIVDTLGIQIATGLGTYQSYFTQAIVGGIAMSMEENITTVQMLGLKLGINIFQGFSQYPIGNVLASELSRQVAEAQSTFNNSGKNAGQKWGSAFLGVVKDNVPFELLKILVDLITPEIQARLASERTR